MLLVSLRLLWRLAKFGMTMCKPRPAEGMPNEKLTCVSLVAGRLSSLSRAGLFVPSKGIAAVGEVDSGSGASSDSFAGTTSQAAATGTVGGGATAGGLSGGPGTVCGGRSQVCPPRNEPSSATWKK